MTEQKGNFSPDSNPNKWRHKAVNVAGYTLGATAVLGVNAAGIGFAYLSPQAYKDADIAQKEAYRIGDHVTAEEEQFDKIGIILGGGLVVSVVGAVDLTVARAIRERIDKRRKRQGDPTQTLGILQP